MLHHDFLWQWCEQWKSRKARLTHLNASYFVARKRWSSKKDSLIFCQVTIAYWLPKYSVTDWRMDLFDRTELPIHSSETFCPFQQASQITIHFLQVRATAAHCGLCNISCMLCSGETYPCHQAVWKRRTKNNNYYSTMTINIATQSFQNLLLDVLDLFPSLRRCFLSSFFMDLSKTKGRRFKYRV